jgi:hypothetical protein
MVAELGKEFLKAVLPKDLVAFPAIKPGGVLPEWQLAQVVEEGMCACGPGVAVCGIPTMTGLPRKLATPGLGTWHTSHAVAILLCVKLALANVFMPAAGTCPTGTLLV